MSSEGPYRLYTFLTEGTACRCSVPGCCVETFPLPGLLLLQMRVMALDQFSWHAASPVWIWLKGRVDGIETKTFLSSRQEMAMESILTENGGATETQGYEQTRTPTGQSKWR